MKPIKTRFLALPAAAVLSLGLVIVAPEASAQDREPVPRSDGRFSITPIEDGYIKLDSRTGVVSECRRDGERFRCRLVPDERDAMQAELERLEEENENLRRQLTQRGLLRSPPDIAEAPPPPGPGENLPDDEEVDRALDLMERFMRRFMNIIREENAEQPI